MLKNQLLNKCGLKYFLFTVATDSLEEAAYVNAILGDHVSAYGTELRLRDPNDRTANFHETSFTFLY